MLPDIAFGTAPKASAFWCRHCDASAGLESADVGRWSIFAALDASRRMTRARNAAFSFSSASSRAEIRSSIVAADAECESAQVVNARHKRNPSFVNLLIVRA